MDLLGLQESTLGLLLLVLGVGALTSFAVAGKLSDRMGSVRVTRWLAALNVLSIVLMASPGRSRCSHCAVLLCFTHGAMDVAMNTWATEVERHMRRSVMSSFHAMWSLGAGLGRLAAMSRQALGPEPGCIFWSPPV